MQTKTHRYFVLSLLFFFGFSVVFLSCKKDETFPDPKISFSTNNDYLSNDTTLFLNDEVKILIIAESMSDVPLTQLHIKVDKDSEITTIDSGINTNILNFEKTIKKGTALSETWSFYVADREGRTSKEISITFSLNESSIFGNIIIIPSIIFGAQDHATIGGFYSLENDQIYIEADAANNQADINLLYYYDNVDADENTIASPGANIDATIYDLSNWTVKNTTRFESKSNITDEEFNNCNNDSLILNNTFVFNDGKRKAKNLTIGDIYAFATEAGKLGLFKVINLESQETGVIEIALKMQE